MKRGRKPKVNKRTNLATIDGIDLLPLEKKKALFQGDFSKQAFVAHHHLIHVEWFANKCDSVLPEGPERDAAQCH